MQLFDYRIKISLLIFLKKLTILLLNARNYADENYSLTNFKRINRLSIFNSAIYIPGVNDKALK